MNDDLGLKKQQHCIMKKNHFAGEMTETRCPDGLMRRETWETACLPLLHAVRGQRHVAQQLHLGPDLRPRRIGGRPGNMAQAAPSQMEPNEFRDFCDLTPAGTSHTTADQPLPEPTPGPAQRRGVGGGRVGRDRLGRRGTAPGAAPA